MIDAQGLVRSALIARFARGQRHGYDRDSIRERAARGSTTCIIRSIARLHAIARNRTLTGLALGYAPEGRPTSGLIARR